MTLYWGGGRASRRMAKPFLGVGVGDAFRFALEKKINSFQGWFLTFVVRKKELTDT